MRRGTRPRRDIVGSTPPACGDAVQDRCGASRVGAQRVGVVGRDVARGDRVDIDALRRPFVGEGLRESGDRRTSRRCSPGTLMPPWKLSRLAVKITLPYPRSSIGAATACVKHELAGQVHLEDAVPCIERVVDGGCSLDRASIVHEDVRREFRRACSGVLHRGAVGEVGADRCEGSSEAVTRLDDRAVVDVGAHADDVRAGGRERVGDPVADSAACSGDDGVAPGQVERVQSRRQAHAALQTSDLDQQSSSRARLRVLPPRRGCGPGHDRGDDGVRRIAPPARSRTASSKSVRW